jgi:TrmH family RNA methyltransferase
LTTKADLKRVRDLHQKKYREQEGRFLVQGPKLVRELLGSGWPVEALYATEAAARELGPVDAEVLPDHEMERLGTLESGNVLVAVVPMPPPASLAAPTGTELVLALDGISDPGNLGTVLRIADWFGISRVLCTPTSVELTNPKCVQATMGALFRVSVGVVDLAPQLADWRAQGVQLYVASMEGVSVFEQELKRPAVLVMGSESHGVSDAVRALRAGLIAIPRGGGGESLNVATATSALCMEFARQASTP